VSAGKRAGVHGVYRIGFINGKLHSITLQPLNTTATWEKINELTSTVHGYFLFLQTCSECNYYIITFVYLVRLKNAVQLDTYEQPTQSKVPLVCQPFLT
jgi:hypothetical protein